MSPLGILPLILFALPLFSNASPEDATEYVGYADDNRDGVNDLYFDSNGDGKNDVDKAIICRNIEYKDDDNDGKNDLFRDEDGDGVNDLYVISKKIPVIDNDNDGKNDITGIKYKKGFYNGSLLGLAIEEKGVWLEDFSDKDNDGCDDDVKAEFYGNKTDTFTDEDGDGICDNRSEDVLNKRTYRSVYKKETNKGRKK